jgi:hypothetical protein
MLNFLNKNKKTEEKVEEKPEEKVEKNPHLANVWNKEDFIEQKFVNRPIEFYIRNYRININVALFFSVAAFLVVFLSGFIIQQKKSEHEYYVTSTDGRVVEHTLTQEDIEKMRKAFREISQRNN